MYVFMYSDPPPGSGMNSAGNELESQFQHQARSGMLQWSVEQ